jgi:hypothetical protein
MQYLGLLFTLTLLAVNLWGLMLIAGLYWRNRWFALAAGPILAVTFIYAIECHHGLGRSLPGLELFSTADLDRDDHLLVRGVEARVA